MIEQTFKNILKYIYSQIPKSIKWTLGAIIILPILGKLVSEWIGKEGLDLSLVRLLFVLGVAVILLLVGILIGSFKAVRNLLPNNKSEKLDAFLGKKVLTVDKVNIGQYEDKHLAVAIMAEISLTDEFQPDIEEFIKRISIGDPFCPKCKRPLDIYRTSWQAGGYPDGFQCEECNTKRQGLKSDIMKDVIKEIRLNDKDYWEKYHTEIDKLIKGNPQKYRLPLIL